MTAPAKRRKPPAKPDHAPLVTVRSLRESLGIPVAELVDRIAEHGGRRYDRSTISNIELGHQFLKPEMKPAWEKALGLPPGTILLPSSSNGNGHSSDDAA